MSDIPDLGSKPTHSLSDAWATSGSRGLLGALGASAASEYRNRIQQALDLLWIALEEQENNELVIKLIEILDHKDIERAR